ncbi:Nitrate transporter [Cladobotryum mycophilum]|uniref:Nitrate/nitrite transporter n=1 Tax=Cladobotryum mycophilum TaxID=491253 RepID=A0ABR0T541_9HYPO
MSSDSLIVFFRSPKINPVTKKARSVPILNPLDPYGRVFFFSWLGFLIAFLSWYAFPPLLTVTIRKDLHMSQNDVANSNIVALLATLLVRLVAGPLCDRFGPRYVFAGLLLCGSIPTGMAGLVTSPKGLIALRFFVGILGGTFVPCQVWCTGFYDKNVVGTANALAGGWGNAVFNSLVKSGGLSDHVAWRVAYIVPCILIISVAVSMLLQCDDTPSGKWSERHLVIQGVSASPPPEKVEPKSPGDESVMTQEISSTEVSSSLESANLRLNEALETAKAEVIAAPTFRDIISVIMSLQSLALAAPYACSFGGELAINSIIGSYYYKNFPQLGQTTSSNWAAMFGLLNVIFRPLGGVIGDLIYRHTNSVWAKKLWMTFLGVTMGAFQLAIGLSDPHHEPTMFGLFAGLAFFSFAANGANFAIVPHVHPSANGILSGFVGGTGNLGGIICAIIFRYNKKSYHTSLWIIGAMSIGINLAVAWIRPIPKGQLGGR